MSVLPSPRVEFWTSAPSDTPEEIKGHTCYFRPERLHWEVKRNGTYVTATGQSTRVPNKYGEKMWRVEGRWGHSSDERPTWLALPVGALARARLAVDAITDLMEQDGER